MSKERDDRWPSVSFTRLGVLLGTPLAVVLSIHGVSWAAAMLKTWSDGDLLTAADLNANLTALNEAMVDTTTDQSVAGKKTFTGDVKVSGKLQVGYQLFFGNPGVPAPGCTRSTGTTVGAFDCKCPAGMVVVHGGYSLNAPGQKANVSRAVDVDTWRFECLDANNSAMDCPYFTYGCARLATD